MNDLLVVMNPRDIPECMDAIRSLQIDKLWLRRLTEGKIADRWGEVLDMAAGYDRLIMQSDDGIPRSHALAAVRGLLDEGHPVVSGYSNLSVDDMRVNLCKSLVTAEPKENSYEFYTLQEVQESMVPAVPTAVVGFALTGMSVDLWTRFPFDVWSRPPGNASDFMLSRRLLEAKIPMVGARDAFVYHGKPVWNTGDRDERRRLLLSEPSEIVLETL